MNKKVLRPGVTILGGMMYSILYAFGSAMEKYGTCDMPQTLLKALMLFPLFSAALWLLFHAEKREGLQDQTQDGHFSAILSFVCILLCWFPMFLIMSPGIFCVDTPDQLGQIVTGMYSTHHPLLHTLFLRFCIALRPILGSLNRCAMMYSLMQMALLAGCFALTSASIARSSSKRAAKWSVVYFALHPLHMVYSISATKDVLFSGAFVLCLALCVEVMQKSSEKQPMKDCRWQYAAAAVSCILAGLLRNNMIYALLVWMLILLAALKIGTARLFVCTALCIVGIHAGGGLLQDSLQAQAGDKREMLSWPVQQLARVRIQAEHLFTEEEKLLLDEIIVKEKWREYDPRISDPVKGAVYTQNLMDSPKKYIDLYLSIGKKAPQMYLDAVVALTYQLLYPYERYNGRFDYAEVSIDPKGFDQCYGAGRVQFNERFAAVRDWLERHIWESGADHVPVLRWIFNMGWIIWMMLFFVLREAWHGNLRRFVVFLLPVLLWGTFLLGPVVYSRYVYPFVCCLPVLASHKKDN